jgi:hypothetical protein
LVRVNKNVLKDSTCPVILPKDIVLVCGFHGFDNTANNERPNLGARLIAFDGISIERGPWTFDTVKKAIKARQRPLTLSFRDDYLTMDQRAILTKAAADVADSNPRRKRLGTQVTPGIPRVINARCKGVFGGSKSDYMSGDLLNNDSQRNDLNQNWLRRDVMNDDSDIDLSVSTDNNSRSSENWKSFSDAGSSSVFSTKFAPLMAGLIAGIKEEQKVGTYTPEYFRRAPDSLDSISHHREFKAGLL